MQEKNQFTACGVSRICSVRMLSLLLLVFFYAQVGSSFQSLKVPPFCTPTTTTASRRQRIPTTSLAYTASDIEGLKLREIKAELEKIGVTYQDCFDRESLVDKLREAMSDHGADQQKQKTEPAVPDITSETSQAEDDTAQDFDEDQVLTDLRSKGIKDLKVECSRRSLRYGTFLEKEDFVQAILKDMKEVSTYSISGVLRPGKCTEVTGEQLDEELRSSDTPILLDVYATWCGPCKMMAPEMEKVAEEVGKKARVAKLDSDKHPTWAGRYRIQGLPTTLILQNGEVVDRLEGAFMKEKLMEFLQPHLN